MLALQIHLTEPCVIIVPDSNELRPLATQNTTTPLSSISPTMVQAGENTPTPGGTASHEARQSDNGTTSASSAQQASAKWHSPAIDLSAGKTSMIRGFVALHLSEPIQLEQLSIEFSGSSHTAGADSTALVCSSNHTLLHAEEYTILDGASIPATQFHSRLPSYGCSDQTDSVCLAQPLHNFKDSYFAAQNQSKSTSQDEIQAINHSAQRPQQNADAAEHKVLSQSASGRAPQDTTALQKTRQATDIHGSVRPSGSNANSRLSVVASVPPYIHRRNRSTGSMDSQPRPSEVIREVESSTDISRLVLFTPALRGLPPMYQDSVFNEMLANQYNFPQTRGDLMPSTQPIPSYSDCQTRFTNLYEPVNHEWMPVLIEQAQTTPLAISTAEANNASEENLSGRRSQTRFKSSMGSLIDAFKVNRNSLPFRSFSDTPKRDKISALNVHGPRRSSIGATFPVRSRPNSALPLQATNEPEKKMRLSIFKKVQKDRLDDLGDTNQFPRFQKLGLALCNSRLRNTGGEEQTKEVMGKRYSKYSKDGCKKSTSRPPTAILNFQQEQSAPMKHRQSSLPVECTSPANVEAPEVAHTGTLKAGVYRFSVLIPVPNHLPPSMVCSYGSVSYALKAKMTYHVSQDLGSISELSEIRHQTSVELVDPLAGSPSLNSSARNQPSGEEDVVNEVYSTYSGITIERMWVDQLHYRIRMDARKFLVGGKISFDIQFNPLSSMKIYKFQADIEQKTQYYMDHKKQYMRHIESQSFKLIMLEYTSPIILVSNEPQTRPESSRLSASDIPLLPLISADPAFVKKSPLMPHVRVPCRSGMADAADRGREAVATLASYTARSIPWNLGFDLRLPSCRSSSAADALETDSEGGHIDQPEAAARGLNFTCQHRKSPIVVKHYLKLRMRVERGDDEALDKRGRRKRYDIILSTPIQIISCRCKPYSLPAYASEDPAKGAEIPTIFKEINPTNIDQEPSTLSPSVQCNCIDKSE